MRGLTDIINAGKQDLLGLIKRFRGLIQKHLETNTQTIEFAGLIKSLTQALEKCEGDLAGLLPLSDPTLRDATRTTQGALSDYFTSKKLILQRHQHNVATAATNVGNLAKLLEHQLDAAKTELEADLHSTTPVSTVFVETIAKAVKTDGDLMKEFNKLRLSIGETEFATHQLSKELGIEVPLKETLISLPDLLAKLLNGQLQVNSEHLRRLRDDNMKHHTELLMQNLQTATQQGFQYQFQHVCHALEMMRVYVIKRVLDEKSFGQELKEGLHHQLTRQYAARQKQENEEKLQQEAQQERSLVFNPGITPRLTPYSGSSGQKVNEE